MTDLPVIQLLTYAFALWFGLYLIARSADKPGLRFAGLGLLAYGVGIGLDALIRLEPEVLRWRLPLLFLPPTFWLGAALYLLPDMPVNNRWQAVLLLEAVVTYVVGVLVDFSGTRGLIYALFIVVSILLLLVALAYIWRRREAVPKNASLPIIIVTIFFVLGIGVIVLPEIGLAPELLYWAIGLDIVLLSYLIVVLDAYDAGETLLPDFVRSMGAAGITALIFGGQVVLVMAITGGLTSTLLLLLLITVATAIAFQTFANPIETGFDRLLLARFPRLQAERARLRVLASALPRVNESLDLLHMDDAQFARLTRRALSDLGDMQRLSASPLINLPLIDTRLNDASNTLERAAELRALLTESIERLKPRGDDDFGTTDEWRYYNALYYPYVIGLKPYSRRDVHNGLTPDAQDALDWLRTYIPERTLYNWQNAAAKLVAQDLRERMHDRSNVTEIR